MRKQVSKGFLLAISVALLFISLMFFISGFLVAVNLHKTQTQTVSASDCSEQTKTVHLPVKSASINGAAAMPSAMSLHQNDDVRQKQRYYPRHLPADISRTGVKPRTVPYAFNGN